MGRMSKKLRYLKKKFRAGKLKTRDGRPVRTMHEVSRMALSSNRGR